MMPTHDQARFIVFSDDWGVHPSSSQHLFRRVCATHQVLWVNTIGMRRPQLTSGDLKKILAKVGRMLGGRRKPESHGVNPANLTVCQPIMLPYAHLAIVRRLNRLLVHRALRRALGGTGSGERCIVVSTVPNASEFIDDLRPATVVYYCVDDFSRWPGLDHELVLGMERRLIEQSQILLATSRQLQSNLARSGKPVELLTHGVDIELFSSRALAAHSAVADLPAPRFGYIGLIDERSDLELMADVAAAMPDCTFVFVGPSAVDAGKCFAHLTNVHLVGPIPYRELPAVMQGLDVLFLPYRINDLTATISPLKLKEYLASGKPVVASPLPEVKPYEGAVSLARDAAGWIAALRAALTRRQLTPDEARMLPGLAGESWDEKVTRFLRLVGEQGNK